MLVTTKRWAAERQYGRSAEELGVGSDGNHAYHSWNLHGGPEHRRGGSPHRWTAARPGDPTMDPTDPPGNRGRLG